MDANEFLLLAVLTVLGGRWVFRACRRILAIDAMACRRGPRTAYLALFPGCIAVLWVALATGAAANVRTDIGVQALFVAGGIAALATATEITGLLGLDAIVDGIERDNSSARRAAAGVWIATMICAVGANLGEGAFVGTTFFPLALALLLLLLLFAAYAATTRGFALIAVERSKAAGVRFAGFAVAASLPLAKAASGDWISLAATMRDFGAALPGLGLLLLAALGVESRAQRSSTKMRAATARCGGIGFAAAYIAAAAGIVLVWP